jgi:hypothetical protein
VKALKALKFTCAYAQAAKDVELLEQAVRIRFEADRNVGRLIIEMQERGELAERGRPRKANGKNKGCSGETFKTLADLGLNKTRSSRTQWLYRLSESKYEKLVERSSRLPSENSRPITNRP